MPLRVRSVVSVTLPCALALAGWWWYVSRKRERIAGLDKEEGAAMGLLASPSEGSNGLVEKGRSRSRTSTDRPKVKEEAPAEQLVVAEVHVESVTPEITRPSTPASCPGSVATGPESEDEPPLLAKTAELGSASESEAASARASAATPWEMLSAADLLTGREESQVATPTLPADEAGSSAVAIGSSRAALTHAVRPEPEGGVSAEKLRVPLAEDLPVNLAMEDLSSGALPTEEGQAPSSPQVEVPPPPFPCLVPTTPAPLPGPESEGHSGPLENGLLEDLAESTNMEEIQRIAAGLVSKVISEARQEVLTESQGSDAIKEEEEEEEEEDGGAGRLSEPSSSTPTSNGRPCSVRNPVMKVQNLRLEGPSPTDHREPGSDEEGLMGALQSECTEEVNGCVAPLQKVAEETSNGRRRTDSCPKRTASAPSETTLEATTPGLAKIQAEEGIARAEDSGCSTCQSEDGISSEDLVPNSAGFSSTVPGSKGDLLDILRSEICARIGLGPGDKEERGSMVEVGLPPLRPDPCQETDLDGSGHMTINETEADQSGGSDVNSMDSVDSGCTLGAVEDQRSDGQTTHLQNSQLVIWEIEVPKHLVGRLIGKQGRYVSFLKQSSGAKIYISTLPYTQEFQICHIEGTQQQVDRALALIGKKFKDLDLTNLYCPPHLPITLPSLPMTTWLLLPNRVPVEVIIVNVVSAGHVFVQQHTHPTFHALRSLDQQMFLCYSQPGAPALPSPVEAGVVCAAPGVEGAWWRAQVISYYKDSGEVEIRYVDYGGYDRVKVDTLRQIRSDFVTLPFQGAEVLLDNIALLPGSDQFSTEANSVLEEMTRGLGLLAQVTNYDDTTGLPLVQMWSVVGEELVSVNRSLAERGFGTWVDSF